MPACPTCGRPEERLSVDCPRTDVHFIRMTRIRGALD